MKNLFFSFIFSLAIFSIQAQNCLEFDGTNDYVNCDSLNLGTGNFTIEFFMFPSSTAQMAVIGTYNSADDYISIVTNRSSTSGKLEVTLFFDNCAADYVTLVATGVYSGKWYHIAVSVDKSGYAKLYVDGLEKSYADISSFSSCDLDNLPLYIGDRGSVHKASYAYFKGRIEEFRVWNIVRSEDQIQIDANHEISSSATGLIRYYRFNSSSGTTLTDETSNQNGTLIGMSSGAWVSSDAPKPFVSSSDGAWNSTSTWNSNSRVNYPRYPWQEVSIEHNISLSDTLGVGKLTIANNKTLTLNSTAALYLGGNFVNYGSLILKSDASTQRIASFIDNGNISNAGTMKVERYLEPSGWHYMSIPVTSASSDLFWGCALWGYDETDTGNWFAMHAGETLSPMKGYDVYLKTTGKTINFAGTFNTGTQSISVTKTNGAGNGWNLVGNPYPSAISWDAPGWTKTNIDNTLYLWSPDNPGVVLKYGTYNHGLGTNKATPYVPTTQAFFVVCNNTSGGTLAMANSVRSISGNQEIFREKQNYLRLIARQRNLSDELIIRLNSDCKESKDDWDSYKMENLIPNLNFYSIGSDGSKFAINTLPEIATHTIVKIILEAQEGESNIDFNLDGFEFDGDIYLQDMLAQKIWNLRVTDDVSFYSHGGVREFNLIFLPPNHVNDIPENSDDDILVYSLGGYIYVTTNENPLIEIYDISGKKLQQSQTKSKLNLFQMSSGYYIVRVIGDNGVFTKKVFVSK